LLIVLKLEKVYLLHQLNIITHKSIVAKWKFYTLLEFFLLLFTSCEIRSYFDIFWQCIYYSNPFNEKFFVENYDLIDHKKLLQLKDLNRDFSKAFHDRFPTFNKLKVCSNFLQCETEMVFEGEMCSNCRLNECSRCNYVMLPKLVYLNGCCESCDGCSQFNDYD
jgi:hypothetical protein